MQVHWQRHFISFYLILWNTNELFAMFILYVYICCVWVRVLSKIMLRMKNLHSNM